MKKILVPCDFSEAAVDAFHSAISLASLEPAEIHLQHVIDLPVMQDPIMMPAFNFEDTTISTLKIKAEKAFSKMVNSVDDSKLHLHTHISIGPIALTILNFIQEEKIDLVVMGTNGASGLTELLVGSNTERIVRNSVAPVLAVRNKLNVAGLKRILLPAPTDFELEEELMARVKQIQSMLQASLDIVWVNTPSNFATDSDTTKKLADFAQRNSLKNYSISIYNDLYEETGIIKFAHQIKADLIMMGTHGRKGLAHIFGGSVTEDVVNHVDLPVWTFGMHNVQEKIITSIL